jgi:hypothetical protein
MRVPTGVRKNLKYFVTSNFIESQFANIDVPIRSQLTSPANKLAHSGVLDPLSPVLSPLPVKVLQPKKKMGIALNLNQTFDDKDRETVIPKLNLDKALQIQQLNAKRSTQ